MPGREVLRVRTGEPGSGKTYSIVCELLEFLDECDGLVIHNLPVNDDAFADHFHERYSATGNGPKPGDIRRRLVRIPAEVEKAWRFGEAGPEEYFGTFDSLADAWIIIDEAHNFIGRKHEAKYRRLWQDFTGELRHRGAVLELCSQSLGKIADEIEADASVWNECTNRETEREHVFWIPYGDWLQFSAKWNGVWSSQIKCQEHRSEMRRWVANDKMRLHWLEPHMFKFYDSYVAPKAGGVSGRRRQPFESRNWFQLVWWFTRRHWYRLVWSPAAAFVLLIVGAFILLGNESTSSALSLPVNQASASDAPTVPQQAARPAEVREPKRATEAGRPGASVVPPPPALSVVGVFDDGAIFSDGTVLSVGEIFDGSPIQMCDGSRGVVLLSDGRRLQVSTAIVRQRKDSSVSRRVQRSDQQAPDNGTGQSTIRSAESDSNGPQS